MFGLFHKKSEKEKLLQKHKQLLAEAFRLSHTNRKASDEKTAEAEALWQRIEIMK